MSFDALKNHNDMFQNFCFYLCKNSSMLLICQLIVDFVLLFRSVDGVNTESHLRCN